MALQLMRSKMKYLKWVLWLVILAFVVLFGSDWSGMNGVSDTRVAATVAGEDVLSEDVRESFRRLESQYRQIFGEQYNSDMARQFNLIGQALRQSVNRKILLREARDLGLLATDGEVREQILSYPAFQDEGGSFIGEEAYRQRLSGARLSSNAFERSLRDDLLLTKLEAILSQTTYVSDAEVEAIYREQAEKASLRYVRLAATSIGDIEVPSERLEQYFNEHPADYQLPEQRAVDYLLVDALALRGEIEISDEELRAYYDDHPDEFSQEEQVRARHILLQLTPDRDADGARQALDGLRAQIEGGADFATVARENSDEPDSAQRGGSLGYFGRNAWGEDFTKIVFNAEVGTLVGPVQTQYGFHLIEVEDHRAGGQRPFEEAKNQIRNQLLGTRASEIAEAKAREIAAATTAGAMTADAFAALAQEHGLEVTNTEPFGANDLVPGIGRGEFNQNAFALTLDNVSQPVKIPRGWTIMRLSAIRPPRLPELADVIDRVRPAALLELQKEQTLERLQTARATLDEGGNLQALADELGVTIQETSLFGKDDSISGIGINPEIAAAALALEQGQLGGPFTDNQGALLFEIAEREHFDPTVFEEKKDETRTAEESQRLNKLRASLIARRMNDLDVRYNPEALAVFQLDGDLLGQS